MHVYPDWAAMQVNLTTSLLIFVYTEEYFCSEWLFIISFFFMVIFYDIFSGFLWSPICCTTIYELSCCFSTCTTPVYVGSTAGITVYSEQWSEQSISFSGAWNFEKVHNTMHWFSQSMIPPYGGPYAAFYAHGGVYAHPGVPVVSFTCIFNWPW